MNPIFNSGDWNRIKNTYEAWWNRTLDRPVLNMTFYGKDPQMPRPDGLITTEMFHLMDDPAMLVAEKMD